MAAARAPKVQESIALEALLWTRHGRHGPRGGLKGHGSGRLGGHVGSKQPVKMVKIGYVTTKWLHGCIASSCYKWWQSLAYHIANLYAIWWVISRYNSHSNHRIDGTICFENIGDHQCSIKYPNWQIGVISISCWRYGYIALIVCLSSLWPTLWTINRHRAGRGWHPHVWEASTIASSWYIPELRGKIWSMLIMMLTIHHPDKPS